MCSKFNSEKENNDDNVGENSKTSDTKTDIQNDNKNSLTKECPVDSASLKKNARKLPDTTEELTLRLNERFSKRRKRECFQEKFFKKNFIVRLNTKQSKISLKSFRPLKFKSGSYKIKHFSTSLKFTKLNPEIVLEFIKRPSVTKLSKLMDVMYTEFLLNRVPPKEIISQEKCRIMSIELKKILYELCYRKFCELWKYNARDKALLPTKQFIRFTHALLKYTRYRTVTDKINYKKLRILNDSSTGIPKKPRLIMCINTMYNVFNILSKNYKRVYIVNKKKSHFLSNNEFEKQFIKLYRQDTSEKKNFLEVVYEFKKKTKISKLSYYQVVDIKHAYESVLQPGEYIEKKDVEICANENYNFKITHNIGSNDFNTNIDEFDFYDIDYTPDCVLNSMVEVPYLPVCNSFNAAKFSAYELECSHQVPSRNDFNFIYDKINRSKEATDTEVHTQSTSNEDRNIDLDISTDDLKGTIATIYSGANIFENLKQERATNTLVKKINCSNNYPNTIEKFNNTLLSLPIILTKSEKRILSTFMFSGVNPCKVMWQRLSPSNKTRMYQVIVYLGSFKMALSDELHLDYLDLIGKNIYCSIDVEKLLKSIQVESCVLQECFTFTEAENLLMWPLGKMVVKNIITELCEKIKEFCRESSQRIVLKNESLFESVSNVQIGKDVLNTELSLEYTHVNTHSSAVDNDELLNDAPGTSNEEVCKNMVNILKSDDFIQKSWKECNNSRRFISKLLKAGVTLPIKESNTGHGSKFVEVFVRWFCKEYLQNDNFYKLAVSIFKNIFRYIKTESGCTKIKVEDAINNALMILYDQPCFATSHESYLNTKHPECLSNSKHDSTNDTGNHSDDRGVNIRAIEELQIEPNVNFQTDPIDTNNINNLLIPSNIPISNELNDLNNVTTQNLVSPDPEFTNYEINCDFLDNFLNENSDNLLENIGVIDDDNIFNTPETVSTDIDGLINFNNIPSFNEFNEDCPFDDEIPTADISSDYSFINNTLDANLGLQQDKNTEQIMIPLEMPVDYYATCEPKDGEYSQCQQQSKNMEEVSMISSDQLVNFDQNDEINLNELSAAVDDQCGFYNAGVLLPPWN